MFAAVHSTLLTFHIIVGTFSLLLFWGPILTKKGRINHNRLGRAYVYAMSGVVASALVLSGMRMIMGHAQAGLALFFLSVLTLVPLTAGVQVLKAKRPTPAYRKLRLGLALALLGTSAVLLVGWQVLDSGLLLAFACIGLVLGGSDLYRFRKKGGSDRTWLREHYEGMLFSGGAAYTAFFAFGGRVVFDDLLTGWLAIIPWILPTLLTMLLLPLVHRRYKQGKKAGRPVPREAVV